MTSWYLLRNGVDFWSDRVVFAPSPSAVGYPSFCMTDTCSFLLVSRRPRVELNTAQIQRSGWTVSQWWGFDTEGCFLHTVVRPWVAPSEGEFTGRTEGVKKWWWAMEQTSEPGGMKKGIVRTERLNLSLTLLHFWLVTFPLVSVLFPLRPPPLPMAQQPLVGQDRLFVTVSPSYSEAPHSVGLLWSSDQPVAEVCTWQHTILTRDRRPCPRREWNPQSHQASGHRPTP